MSDTTKVKNLWGKLPIEDNIRTPYIILKEQASILTEATNGLLIGKVIKKRDSLDNINCDLIIKVPSLDNYTISIVDTIYPVTIYPVEIKGSNAQYYSSCDTEEEIENTLSTILSSEEVRRIISGLLSEVRADDKE
ncbi:MAG: hypothetical protein ACFCAD_01615 [Pleurocapsa sp.]